MGKSKAKKGERDPNLDEIFEKAGGQAELARNLSKFPGQTPINRSGVSCWWRVPDDRIVAVHIITGVPFRRVRADLYDPKVIKKLKQQTAHLFA